jgi:1-acyl-sn-glycerol-3-phosphate acyltransferase
MSFSQQLVIYSFRALMAVLCRIDDAQLAKVPDHGPLILVTNHVNLLEIPIIYTHLKPRPVHGMVLASRWKNPFFRWLLDTCESIPVRRGEADVDAIRASLKKLSEGCILIIGPEGTRSRDGRLRKPHPGAVLLALHSGAPMMPVAYFGSEGFDDNLRHLRRTDFHIAVGRPFRLEAGEARVDRKMRQQMIDEVFYRIAALLPEQYRGAYADLSKATEKYLDFKEEFNA